MTNWTQNRRALDAHNAERITQDMAAELGITGNAVDRFDLTRAIKRCDELVTEIRRIQMIHSENLCRVANHLAAAAGHDSSEGWPGYPHK